VIFELCLVYISNVDIIPFFSSIGTADKILEAKEKERLKEDKGKGKETPRKKAKR
jgi:hypothetical protein